MAVLIRTWHDRRTNPCHQLKFPDPEPWSLNSKTYILNIASKLDLPILKVLLGPVCLRVVPDRKRSHHLVGDVGLWHRVHLTGLGLEIVCRVVGHLVWGAGFRQCGRSVGLRVWGFEFGVRAWRHSSMGQQMCLPCRLERAVGILKVPRPHGPRLCHVAMSLGCCATPNLKHCPGVRPRLLVAEVLLDMLDVLLSLPISIMSSSSYSSTRFSAVLYNIVETGCNEHVAATATTPVPASSHTSISMDSLPQSLTCTRTGRDWRASHHTELERSTTAMTRR